MSKHHSHPSANLSVQSDDAPENEHVPNLRRILKRFTKNQLFNEVSEIYNLSQHLMPDYQRRLDKVQTIEFIVKVLTLTVENIEDVIAVLELKYYQTHCNSRQWSAIVISSPEVLVEADTLPEKFQKKLEKYLNRSHFLCNVLSEIHNSMMWTVISAKKMNRTIDKIFLVIYPHLPIILYCNMKSKYEEIIVRALVRLFDGTGSRKIALKSKNLETLALLICEKELPNLDESQRPVERKEREIVSEKQAQPENIINEDIDDENDRELYLHEIFGSKERPPIEDLTYKVSSEFFGFKDNHSPIPVQCQAIFKGKNVLEGIHHLVKKGIGTYPLPDHIVHADKFCTNNFNIKIKRRET